MSMITKKLKDDALLSREKFVNGAMSFSDAAAYFQKGKQNRLIFS